MQGENRRLVSLSKKISYLLRHGGAGAGLPVRADGCVAVSILLKKLGIREEVLEQVVLQNDKQRFEFLVEEGQRYIRARNGHTLLGVQPEAFMEQVTEVSTVARFHTVHCTFAASVPLILAKGLSRMRRHHVHFYTIPRAGELARAPRQLLQLPMQRDAYIELDTALALDNGYRFFRQGNYLLCEGVNGLIPPVFFREIYCKSGGGVESCWKDELLAAQKECQAGQLLVLDFEANCVEGGRLPVNEIIEIPVVPVDMERQEVSQSMVFHTFVAPTEIPLTRFATELCGITPEMLAGQPTLPQALQALEEHIEHNKLGDAVYITCGDFDLRTCLAREARSKKLALPWQMRRYINVKEVFAQFTRKGGHWSMVEMLEELGLALQGRHHSGLDDARNIARVVLELSRRGCLFTSNYIKAVG